MKKNSTIKMDTKEILENCQRDVNNKDYKNLSKHTIQFINTLDFKFDSISISRKAKETNSSFEASQELQDSLSNLAQACEDGDLSDLTDGLTNSVAYLAQLVGHLSAGN